MKMQLAFCWAFAYSSISHWISIFTHDSAFVTCTPPRAGVVLSMSPERHNRQCLSNRTDGNISRRRRKKYSSFFVGWYALIQKCLGWQCVTLTSLENFTHKTFIPISWENLLTTKARDFLYSPRISAHVYPQMFALHATTVSTTHKACYWMSFSMTLITFSKIPRARDINLSSSRAFSVD